MKGDAKSPQLEIPNKQALIEATRRSVERRGGFFAVRNESGLESALARVDSLLAYADPQPDIFASAAVVAEGIVRNHPFADGNKRSALIAAIMTVELNGSILDAREADAAEAIEQLSNKKIGADDFAQFLRRFSYQP